MLLHYTGIAHFSGTNNWELYKRQIDGKKKVQKGFEKIAETSIEMERALEAGEPLRAVVMRLAPGATRTLDLRTPALRRGRHRMGPVTVTTGFPLGLATKTLVVPESEQHLWVYPRLFQVGSVPIAGEQFQSMGEVISPRGIRCCTNTVSTVCR